MEPEDLEDVMDGGATDYEDPVLENADRLERLWIETSCLVVLAFHDLSFPEMWRLMAECSTPVSFSR